MANSYIVEVFKWDVPTNVYIKKDDCIMTLDNRTGELTIESSTKQGVSYMNFNIVTDDFTILSKEQHNISNLQCALFEDYTQVNQLSQLDQSIDYEMRYKNTRFGVRFDTRSSGSAANFQSEYTKLRTKYRTIEKYKSGRIHFEGFRTESGATGMGIEYYDADKSPIKYVGEFEDGIYDGEGEFYSINGDIKLHCNNICKGIPNLKGTLVVGKNKNKTVKVIEMKDFKNISANDNNYLLTIYSRIDSNAEETLELIEFEALSIDDRLSRLFREVQKIKRSLKDANNHFPSTVKKGSLFNLF